MPTVVSITLDAQKYQQQLDEVVAKTRTAAGQMGQTAPPVQADMKSVTAAKKAVQELADNAATKVQKLASGFHDADKAANSFGANAKKHMGSLRDELLSGNKALAQIKSGILSLLNPWSLVVAAVGLAVTVCTKLYDLLTESAEEFGQKAAAAAELARQHAAKLNEQAAAAEQYIRRLNALTSAESDSIASRRETLQLLAQLESYYGKLGASVDGATGKITNLADVEERLRAARAQRQAESVEAEMNATLRQGRAEFMKWRSSGTLATERTAGYTFDYLATTKDWQGQAEYWAAAAQHASTADDVAALSKIADYWRKAAELREKYNNLRETGYETPEAKMAAEIARNEERERRAATAKAAQDAAEAAKKQRLERERAGAIADEKDPAKRRAMLEEDLRREKDEAAKHRAEADKPRTTGDHNINYAAAMTAEKKYQESLQRQYELQRQINAEKKKEAEFNSSLADQAKDLAARAAERAGRDREYAERKALEEAEKRKGGKLTASESDAVKRLSALEYDMSHADKRGADLAIKTNSLTARGGFRSGAVTPDAQKYTKLAVDVAKQQLTELGKIEDQLKKWDSSGDG